MMVEKKFNPEEKKSFENHLFMGLISSLSTGALVHLGKTPDPVTNEMHNDREAAKVSIDMLCVLQKKTHGNLTQDEETVLASSISSLQLAYVQNINKPEEKVANTKNEASSSQEQEDQQESNTEDKDRFKKTYE
ncbi:MAG: DUF1844 domain-containing protein [Candidatus Theseobacter exili]|nr:DUF1844 domain-containing protein [Candidatus Theseobacter exili]